MKKVCLYLGFGAAGVLHAAGRSRGDIEGPHRCLETIDGMDGRLLEGERVRPLSIVTVTAAVQLSGGGGGRVCC